jgi:hypothetical protein
MSLSVDALSCKLSVSCDFIMASLRARSPVARPSRPPLQQNAVQERDCLVLSIALVHGPASSVVSRCATTVAVLRRPESWSNFRDIVGLVVGSDRVALDSLEPGCFVGLLRHNSIRVTMDVYDEAMSAEKQMAHQKVLRLVTRKLDRTVMRTASEKGVAASA